MTGRKRTGLVLAAALLTGLAYGGLAAQERSQEREAQEREQNARQARQRGENAQRRGERGENRQRRGENAQQRRERVTQAVAVLQATEESGVRGTIYFTQRGQAVEIKGEIMGLEPGKHGFHIHQYGDLSDLRKGQSAGGHFNPTNQPHGRPDAEERHVGDLGNIEADEDGVAMVQMQDSVIRLNGPQSILGRAVVVHSKADEFTQPSGDAGDRLAMGVIGIANPDSQAKSAAGSRQRTGTER